VHPAEAVGQNERPFGVEGTLVISNDIILNMSPGPLTEGGIWTKFACRKTRHVACSDDVYCRMALLSPLLF